MPICFIYIKYQGEPFIFPLLPKKEGSHRVGADVSNTTLEDQMKTTRRADLAVSYDLLDLFKRNSLKAGRETSKDIERLGVTAVDETYGESVFLYRNGDHFIGHLNESLGTKNLVADAMAAATPSFSYYDSIAQDTVAMVVNDMITLGVFPFGLTMLLAVGDSKWMNDDARINALIAGWKRACIDARCCWGGGETPALSDIIAPDKAALFGSAVGKTSGFKRFQARDVRPGDQIVFFESSGIHSNGLSKARDIASGLDDQYRTRVPGTDKTFGELLLRPTHIYVRAIEALMRAGVDIHYTANITGHGWRKIMRAPQPLTYVIEELPRVDPLFNFIQERMDIIDAEMYGTFNMGAGFAIFVPSTELPAIGRLAKKFRFPYRMFRAGYVASGGKQVVIQPMNIVFHGSSLAIR